MKKYQAKNAGVNFSTFVFWAMLVLTATFTILVFDSTSKKQSPNEKIKATGKADFGGVENILGQSGNWQSNDGLAYYDNKLIRSLTTQFPFPETNVLSASSGNEKWIDISISEQKLRAYDGNILVYEFPVSTGLPWTPTVKGDFNIWYKIKYTRMTGGSKDDGSYYDLPNVPYNMFFYKDYALHGTYWHNNFGNPMSHGCVNIAIPNAEKLFYWTDPTVQTYKNTVLADKSNPGTRVVVHD